MADSPNVLWLNMEDTSARRLGCYGDGLARTPNIDGRLAGAGRRYENAFCTSPVCSPSRSATITGLYQTAIGCHQHRASTEDGPGMPGPYEAVPPHYVTAITEYLRRAGYYCAKRGKNDFQFGVPFTVWNDDGGHYDPTEEAPPWRERDGDRPFFVSLQNGVTHESGMWPPGEGNSYGGDGGDLETDPGAVDVPPYLPDCDATREAIARHYDNLEASDRWIGRILDELAADGLAADTVVVLWSDHGEGLPRCKSWLYEGGLRVPLIVRWPGEIEPGPAEELVSNVDLGRTVLELAGAEVPAHLQGRQLVGPERDDPREYVFAARDRQDGGYMMQRAVRDGRFKYIRNWYPGRPNAWFPYRNRHPVMRELKVRQREDRLEGAEIWFDEPRPAEELYDLESDPHETENLADDPAHADALERLRAALDDWRRRTGDQGETAEDQLVESWWPGGEQPETAAPTFVPNAPGNPGREATPGGATLEAPATLALHCSTQGASVAYATERGADPDWRLYDGPIDLPPGETTVRAKAVRYGYAESDERVATFAVD